MSDKSFGRALLGPPIEIPNDAGGVALKFEAAFDSARVDLSNEENTKVMATNAIAIADSLHSLVHEYCDTNNPISTCGIRIEVLISLGALSSEIYMKAILYSLGDHNGKKIYEHRLNELYSWLPEDVKQRLKGSIPELEGSLVEISKAYEEMRYVFEFNAFNKEYLLVFDLMDALHEYCLNLPIVEMPIMTYGGGIVRIE